MVNYILLRIIWGLKFGKRIQYLFILSQKYIINLRADMLIKLVLNY